MLSSLRRALWANSVRRGWRAMPSWWCVRLSPNPCANPWATSKAKQDNISLYIRRASYSLFYPPSRSVEIFDVQNDTEKLSDYVRVLDPHAPEISFIRTHCPKRQVLYVGCGDLRCGVQSALPNAKQHLSLPKMSAPGDWPWLVALFREDIHVCDGTLISPDWVLTTESCFQGQPRATWMAIVGAVRLSAKAPWTQRRRIIGMIKSPVEGSTAALVRLETPVSFSDHVRPICLPDALQRQLKQPPMQRRAYVPVAERLEAAPTPAHAQRRLAQETQQFFLIPSQQQREHHVEGSDGHAGGSSAEEQEQEQPGYDYLQLPHPEALQQPQLEDAGEEAHSQLNAYPLPDSAPQVNYYGGASSSTSSTSSLAGSKSNNNNNKAASNAPEQIWTNCNTLGWSRQRDHLQRVQLKIGDMAPCENVSITTVNSMCMEATYQKYDCTVSSLKALKDSLISAGVPHPYAPLPPLQNQQRVFSIETLTIDLPWNWASLLLVGVVLSLSLSHVRYPYL